MNKSVDMPWRWMLLGALYVLILLGSIYRVDYIIEHNPVDNIFSDPQRHWEQGTEPLRIDPMTMTDPILYQLFIGALGKLTIKIPALIVFYTALLSLLLPWAWYRFFRELQPSKLAAVAGWAVITWMPSWNGIYAYFMQETLFLPLLGAALHATWRCRRKQTRRSFLLMVLLWTLASLTRSVGIPMAAVATVWVWWKQDDKLKRAAYMALILVLFLGPLTYRSLEMVHIAAPTGIAQMNMIYAMSGKKEVKINYQRGDGVGWEFGFMSPALLVEPFEPISHWQTQRDGQVWIRIDMSKGNRDWAKSIRENFPDFKRYLWITKENLILLFFSDSWPDSNQGWTSGQINYRLRWIWAPFAVLCVVLSAVFWRRLRGQYLLASIIFSWFLLQGLLPMVPNEGRYRKPIEGLLVAQFVLLAGGARPLRNLYRKLTDMPNVTEETFVTGRPTAFPAVPPS